MTPGEIWYASFPYAGSDGGKYRPVLVLTDGLGQIPEFIAAYITSAQIAPLLASDLEVDPAVGLKPNSTIRLHKIGTLHQFDFKRMLGAIDQSTWIVVQDHLRTILLL